MRKSKLISVRVPLDVLDRLDVLLRYERWITRSDVICALLEMVTDTLGSRDIERLSHVSEYWGNPILEMHIRFREYGKERSVDYIREEQKSTDV